MSEALWGFLGVIIGALVSLLGEQFTTKREREARQALREQERKDRRDAFCRDSLLAAQEAVSNVVLVLGVDYDHRTEEEGRTGSWLVEVERPPELQRNWQDAHRQLIDSRTRLFDTELREMVLKFNRLALNTVTAESQSDMEKEFSRVLDQSLEVNERIATLLPHFF